VYKQMYKSIQLDTLWF